MPNESFCDHIRPYDGETRCNRARYHLDEHMRLRCDGSAIATWDDQGRERCNCCGNLMNADGFCTAPLSVAD